MCTIHFSQCLSYASQDDSDTVTVALNCNDSITTYTHVNDLPASGKKINETRQYTYDERGNQIKEEVSLQHTPTLTLERPLR